MSQLFISIVGFNASGKTTVAEKLASNLNLNRVNGDDFRQFVYQYVAYFHSTNNSYPSPENSNLNPLVLLYRLEMSRLLLKAGQDVIVDGSGFTLEERQKIFKIAEDLPGIKTVIIWTKAGEDELLKRLEKRDKASKNTKWKAMHQDFKKKRFEPPSIKEADLLLHYDQTNYEEIENQIRKLI